MAIHYPTERFFSMTGQPTDNKNKNSWDQAIIDSFITIVVALALALGFRSVAYEPFHIPTGSMKANLLVGDYLFVSKYSYGYSRYSFPFGLPLFEGRILEMNKPKRGDVVVFRLPSNTHIDFIKRVIGLPGDHIQVTEGIVYINGEPLKRRQLEDFSDDEDKSNVKTISRFDETLPEGKEIEILKQYKDSEPDKGGPADNTPLFEVPAGHYFMMGDNRDNSHDSRFSDVGFIPEENIVGRAEIIFFSTDGSAAINNPASWVSAIRGERLLKLIQ